MMIPAIFSYIAAVNLLKPPCQLARQNTSATPYQHVPSAAPWHHLLVSHCSLDRLLFQQCSVLCMYLFAVY